MRLRGFCALYLLLLPVAAEAWSAATQALAWRAETEFPDRLVVVASLEQAQQQGLPPETLREFRDAADLLFRRTVFKGVVAPFRHHLFDNVRCAIFVPANVQNPQAELWTLAHEIGHCVARLNGWQESLWTDKDLNVRHQVESWADAFATLAVPPAERPQLAAMALQQRARLGGDAAYMTDKAIHCSLRAEVPIAPSLTATGAQVERLLQAGCLAEPARLQATHRFLSSLR